MTKMSFCFIFGILGLPDWYRKIQMRQISLFVYPNIRILKTDKILALMGKRVNNFCFILYIQSFADLKFSQRSCTYLV